MGSNELPPVILTTPRLTLRALSSVDREAFIAYRQNPEVAKYQGWVMPYTEKSADNLLAAQQTMSFPPGDAFLQVAIHDKEGKLMGDLGVRGSDPEYQPNTFTIGFTIAPEFQGKGIATEALSAMIHHLFEDHNAHRIQGQSDARNPGSPKVLRRVGYRHEGRTVDSDWFRGEWTSIDMWAMLRSDYEQSMCKNL